MTKYLSVSNLTKYLKMKFDRDPYLERVYLTGQISNFRPRPTHQYFSLKDEKSVIQVTMWSGVYKRLGFQLEEGMQVNVIGRVQVYEPGGSYSIIVESIEPDGVGALALQFEQLKKALQKEGLFEDRFKQPLPRFVKKIGVITSQSGAVIRDIITTVSRRFPGVEILLYPTKVQGTGAAEEVAANILRANQRKDLDVLIVGRGGGSIEDLWAFNEEKVVRAIFESRLPVISSVGHETDTTLADFVADRRAATPTAAAELATPITKVDILNWITERERRQSHAVNRLITQQSERLNRLQHSIIFRQPERLYDGYLQKVDQLSTRLTTTIQQRYQVSQQRSQLLDQKLQSFDLLGKIHRYREWIEQQERLLKNNITTIYDQSSAKVEKLAEALMMLDTSRIVARGYAMVEQNGAIVSSVASIKKGDELVIQMRDGQAEVEVKNVQNNENI